MADGSVILTRPSGYAMEVSGLVSPSRRREGEPELLRLSLNPGLLVRLRRPSVARAARSLEEAGRRVTKLFGPAARCFITPSPHRTEKTQMDAGNPSHRCCSPQITQKDTDSIAFHRTSQARRRKDAKGSRRHLTPRLRPSGPPTAFQRRPSSGVAWVVDWRVATALLARRRPPSEPE